MVSRSVIFTPTQSHPDSEVTVSFVLQVRHHLVLFSWAVSVGERRESLASIQIDKYSYYAIDCGRVVALCTTLKDYSRCAQHFT